MITTYEIQVELETGYYLQALEAAASAEEARNNLFRKFNEMGWRPGKQFVLGTPVAVDVLPLSTELLAQRDAADVATIRAGQDHF